MTQNQPQQPPDDPAGLQEWIRENLKEMKIRPPIGKIPIVTDTTDSMAIYRGQVLLLEDRYYFVLGDVFEPRFGLTDQPKYWVKKCRDLHDRTTKICKLVFNEEFIAHIGPIRIRCFRSPEKESRVLDLVQNDTRFMQGHTVRDGVGNEVRIIDFIFGDSLYNYILGLTIDHEEYFHTVLPGIMHNIFNAMEAISMLHDNNLCHGDIRNDHILIDKKTDEYRWIDFDLCQHYPDFDVWSLGNILEFVTGQGIRTFHEVNATNRFSEKVKNALTKDDASAFYLYRIMNLKKVFDYIPKSLNDILMRFSSSSTTFFETVDELKKELGQALGDLPAPGNPKVQ